MNYEGYTTDSEVMTIRVAMAKQGAVDAQAVIEVQGGIGKTVDISCCLAYLG